MDAALHHARAARRFQEFSGKLSFSDGAIHDPLVQAVQELFVDSYIHWAKLNISIPLTLILPRIGSIGSRSSLLFLYCSGVSGAQVILAPYGGDVNKFGSTINGSSSATYSHGSTGMIIMLFMINYNWFACPVSFSGGGGSGSTTVSAGSGITVVQAGSDYTITNASPNQVVNLSSGTGIGISGSYPNYTVTNLAPQQNVSLAAGSGIGVSGSFPNFTVTNSSPDQVVSLTQGTGMAITGSYPAFTITNNAPDLPVSLVAGSGMAVTGTYPNFTVTNAAPDTVVTLTSGTGIGITGAYPSYTVTNSSPDQLVSLTSASSHITVSGTYPNFVIDTTLMAASYAKGTRTVASLAIGTTPTQSTTGYVVAYASSDWTTNGAGGMVYDATAKGRPFIFSIDYGHASTTCGADAWLIIQKNGSYFPAWSEKIATGNYTDANFKVCVTTDPIAVEPGDTFYLALQSSSAGTTTTISFVINIVAA